MKVFTYKNYIQCIHTLRLNTLSQLAEESTEYRLETKENNLLDKQIRKLLKDTEELAQFINMILMPKEKVQSKELILYTNGNISKEADIIYQIKNKEMYFWIKHQSSIDNNIQYKILNDCIDIIRKFSRNQKNKKMYTYPIIVPIVIYTGENKWKFPKKAKKRVMDDYLLDNYQVDLDYNLIDIKKISNQILLESNTLFSNVILIEKAQTKEEMIENLASIIKATKKSEKLKKLVIIMNYLLDNLLQDILEKIEKKQINISSNVYN